MEDGIFTPDRDPRRGARLEAVLRTINGIAAGLQMTR